MLGKSIIFSHTRWYFLKVENDTWVLLFKNTIKKDTQENVPIVLPQLSMLV